MGHLRRELERAAVGGQALVELAARAHHHRVVEVGLGAVGHGVLGGVPEDQVVGVVDGVKAGHAGLDDEPADHDAVAERRRWRSASSRSTEQRDDQRRADAGQVPEALRAHGGQEHGDVGVREVGDRDPDQGHRKQRERGEAQAGSGEEGALRGVRGVRVARPRARPAARPAAARPEAAPPSTLSGNTSLGGMGSCGKE